MIIKPHARQCNIGSTSLLPNLMLAWIALEIRNLAYAPRFAPAKFHRGGCGSDSELIQLPYRAIVLITDTVPSAKLLT